MRQFKAADARALGAGEGAFFVPEELAFNEVFGDGGAVYGNHGGGGPAAARVQGAGGKFLARAVFAGQEHPGIRWRDAAQHFLKFGHGRGLAHQLVFIRLKGLEQGVFPAEGAGFQGARRNDHDLIQGKGLFNKVVRALADGGNGGLYGAVPGNDDDGQLGVGGLERSQRGQAIHAREPDIQEDQVRRGAVHNGQALFSRSCLQHFVALILQDAAEGKADCLFIINNQNFCCHVPFSSCGGKAAFIHARSAWPFAKWA